MLAIFCLKIILILYTQRKRNSDGNYKSDNYISFIYRINLHTHSYNSIKYLFNYTNTLILHIKLV